MTHVIFRKWRNGAGVIALFPFEPGTMDAWTCNSYEHVGQHGSASPSLLSAHTKPATLDESADLKLELERIGYELVVMHRIPRNAVDVRRAKLSEVSA